MESTQVTGTAHHIVIVGGGISGLSLAWYLEKQAAEHNLSLSVTVLEKSDRWGGKILTEEVESDTGTPFVVEAGPDSFLTQKPAALQLARDLGLSDDLLGTNDAMRYVFVLNRGKPVKLPDGVLLIVPTKFMPFALSPLISIPGKIRMGMDLFIPPKTDDEDETLGDFIRRRLGSEALDKIAEPLMSGIYNADADQQSVMATFPRFRTLEKKYGNLIRGMLASRRMREQAARSKPQADEKVSTFMSFNRGTQQLIDALTAQLQSNLRLETGVRTLEADGTGGYRIMLDDDSTLTADAVVLTTPAYTTADLVHDLAPEAATTLKTIRYVSTGTISLAYRKADLPELIKGFGLVIPATEKRSINAVTVSSTKFDRRAPEAHVLLRAFFGGSRSPQSMDLPDDDLVRQVRDELRQILKIEAEPLFHRIYRWWHANPQYDVGHLKRVEHIENNLPAGVTVTGSSYRGVGLPDCIAQSQQTADRIITRLTEAVTTQPDA